MREIKFRAWYKPLKIMAQSDDLESINFDTKVLGVYITIESSGFHKLRMSDFELMQYTGLKDKNGKEIYEGDIVSLDCCESDGEYGIYDFNFKGTFKVEYNDECAGFCLTQINANVEGWHLSESQKDLTVIGNIYENVNLLGLAQSAPDPTEQHSATGAEAEG